MTPTLLLITTAAAAPPDIDTPLRSQASAPSNAAVVVGIEDYAFLPDVPYALRDAAAVRDALVHTLGIPEDRVQLLRGGNREQILRAVDQVRDAERVWIYFAGHGAAAADGRLVLVGDDAKRDPEVFQERSLTIDDLTDRLPPDSVVVLDTCYAGSGRDGAELLPGARFAVPTYARPESGSVVWTAASPSEISGPYAPAEHGLFTYFAVGALRGWADGELSGSRDGQVTLAEAQAYVARALSTLSTRGQTPVSSGDAGAVLVAAGGLEEGPTLSGLPDTDGVVRAAVPEPPVRSGDTRPPTGPADADGAQLGSMPMFGRGAIPTPLSAVRGGFEDGAGRRVALYSVSEPLRRDLDGSRALRKLNTSTSLLTFGGMGLLTGTVFAVVGTTFKADSSSPREAFQIGGAATAGLGLAVTSTGVLLRPPAKKRVAEAYNALAAP